MKLFFSVMSNQVNIYGGVKGNNDIEDTDEELETPTGENIFPMSKVEYWPLINIL